MLYEPLPGSAAVILAQLGIIEHGQIDALGARTYDAEAARLSLALDDGRTVELERAMHLHTENGYAVRIRSRAGQTISRSFIHIDRDLGVRNLHNDRMIYIDDSTPIDEALTFDDVEIEEAEVEAIADKAHEEAVAAQLAPPIPAEEPSALEAVIGPAPEEPAVEEAAALIEAAPTTIIYFHDLSSAVLPEAPAEEPPTIPAEQDSPEMVAVPSETMRADPDQSTPHPLPEVFASEHSEPTQEAIRPDPLFPFIPPRESSFDSAPEPSPDPDPRYAPLLEALDPEDAAEFLWIAQTGTIHTYEHRETLRYIHIDAPSGLFYDQTRTPVSRTAALRRVLTPRPQPLQHPAESEPVPPIEVAHQQPPVEPAPQAPSFPHHDEPALRTRAIPAARAAVRPAPEVAAPEQGLSLDAFTRKHGTPLERESWRNRFAALKAFRLNRNNDNNQNS